MKYKSLFTCVLLLAWLALSGSVPAEEAFFEESFLTDGSLEESFFDEESFGGEEFFSPDSMILEEETEAGEVDAEGRSVIWIPNEDIQEETADLGWDAPVITEAFSPKPNQVTLVWTHTRTKLAKNMKFYVYEMVEDGKGIQVGATTKKKLTIKNVLGGEHRYFVRLESVDVKYEREQYGVKSEIVPITVQSELWKKAPAVTVKRTGQNEIALSWKADTGAALYELEIQHGSEKPYRDTVSIPEVGSFIEYSDADAIIGKNTYKLHAVSWSGDPGKTAKKVLTLTDLSWKTAPVVMGFSQLTGTAGRVHFTHISTAEQYLVQVGKKKSYPSFQDGSLKYDADTDSYYADVLVGGKGKQKVTVMPLGRDVKGKLVKGAKSAAYSVKILKQNLLGAVNVKAYADGFNVFVKWGTENPDVKGFHVYLFNADHSIIAEGELTEGKNEAYFRDEVPAGTYTVFVRALRGLEENEDPLFDTQNVECQTVVVVDGVKLKDLLISLDKTEDEIVMKTLDKESTTKITASKTNTTRPVIWRSLDPTVATVDENGIVTALKGGTARIAATAGYNTEICTVTINPVTYRALLIGNSYTGYDYLAGPKFDIDRMEAMLKKLKKTPYQVTKKRNLESTEFGTAIIKAFADADENDVSFFYYSGHGNEEDGALCGHSDGGFVTPAQLRTYLDLIKGQKVVFSDSCFSGKLINRGETNNKAIAELNETELSDSNLDLHASVAPTVSQEEIEAANQAFIDAFRPKVMNRGEHDLETDDYYVITAATGDQTSSDRSVYSYKTKPVKKLGDWYDGYYMAGGRINGDKISGLKNGQLYHVHTYKYSYKKGRWIYTVTCGGVFKVVKVFGTGAFTRSILRGLGWDMDEDFSRIMACSMMADQNNDRRITFQEMYEFAYEDLFDFLGSGSHKAQVYPENCGKVFFAN